MLVHFVLCVLRFPSVLVLPTDQEKEFPYEEDVDSRIYFGDRASIKNYPFFASIRICGAVIISPLWVLTAAHCVKNAPSLNSVWVGGSTLQASKRVAIHQIISHPGYTLPAKDDIALIKLKEPLKFSETIQQALLPYPQALEAVKGQDVELIGRGTDENGILAEYLQRSKMEIFTTDYCQRNYPLDGNLYLAFRYALEEVKERVICTVREKGLPGVCEGDSGSPLVQGNVLKGLVSYTFYKRCYNFRDSYMTNVEFYIPWIEDVTGL